MTFHWTSDNRLYRYKVTSGDTVTVDLCYDGHGRLARKYVHGTMSRRYIWNGDNLFAELDASGNKILEYSYYGGLDNLHAVIGGDGEPYFGHKDGMGNVIALTDRTRNVEEQYTYERIWGGLSLDTLSSCEEAECNRSKYKGALYIGEEAGVYYMRNRWYEPLSGRQLPTHTDTSRSLTGRIGFRISRRGTSIHISFQRPQAEVRFTGFLTTNSWRRS